MSGWGKKLEPVQIPVLRAQAAPVALAETESDERELKSHFADEFLRRPTDPYTAALQVFKGDSIKAMRAASEWPRDTFVKNEMARLLALNGEMAYAPSKFDTAMLLWNRINRRYIEDKDFIKGVEVYAKLTGQISDDEPDTTLKKAIAITVSETDTKL